MIADVSPITVAAGGPAFTLTVLGDYFDTSATVQWQGANISTTYVSPTELQAQISASYIAASGTIPVDVSLSNGNQSNTINFVISALPSASSGATMTTINVPANDMVWDATSQQIYLSIPNSSTTNGNTITALDPTTGQLGVSQYAGSNPDKLALSSDGSYLYAGIDGSASVQRFNLPGLGTDISIPLGSSTFGPYSAMDVEAAPGLPHTIAVVLGNVRSSIVETGGVHIFDDATARPTIVPAPGWGSGSASIDSIQWGANATQVYGGGSANGDDEFSVLSVNSSGVQLAQSYPDSVSTLHFDETTGYVYSNDGQAINPATGTPVGTYGVQGGIMVPDGRLGYAYFLYQPQAQFGSLNYTLQAFDLTHFTPIGSITLSNLVGTPTKIIRWGANGLAVLTQSSYLNSGAAVYVITGNFVTNP